MTGPSAADTRSRAGHLTFLMSFPAANAGRSTNHHKKAAKQTVATLDHGNFLFV
ncbi:hypothetical protein [Bradyrhizobium sp. CCBAU 45389]|uniref:hypothetical protein n=1 Tax=Bradyrhizobium sp. CCBAU 45389 TaxID=858429 RepID=UPI002306B62C|nr:hypothetical protein [Bradyrhizobium sp. CCBAU 45389]